MSYIQSEISCYGTQNILINQKKTYWRMQKQRNTLRNNLQAL